MLDPIEETVKKESTHISEAFNELLKYRETYADSTIQSYRNDIKNFELYLMDNDYEPILLHGEKLYIVHGWVSYQKKQDAATSTINRRLRCLANLYKFYENIAIVSKNPFNNLLLPGGSEGSHSYTPDLSEMKQVYKAIEQLKDEGIDVEIPAKLLIFTGLRNHAFAELKVGDIDFEQGVLIYNPKVNNSKKRKQIIPLPPRLLCKIREYIELNNLGIDDPLCYGIKGLPIKNKQLNRITDVICKNLNWTGDKKLTPHGFRYFFSTILDEKNVARTDIQFYIGHRQNDNIQYYIKSNKRKLRLFEKHINELENELENSLKEQSPSVNKLNSLDNVHKEREITGTEPEEMSEDFLLKILDLNPELGMKLVEKKYSLEQANVS